MTKSIKWHNSALSALFLIAAVSALHALSLTGNVETDFASPDAVVVADAVNATGEETPDVGLPPAFPFPTSGWDIKDFRFVYDAEEDALYVGINFFGIAGDADGDGNPSSASPALTALGGQTLPTWHQARPFRLNSIGMATECSTRLPVSRLRPCQNPS
jgi:hypothetical protein